MIFKLMISMGLICTTFLVSYSLEAIPLKDLNYDPPELLARASLREGYNLPPTSYLSDTSPVINNKGNVVFKVMAVEGKNTPSIWFKSKNEKNGKIIYSAPEMRLMSDPTLNDSDDIAFTTYDDGITDGILILDPHSLILRPAFDSHSYPIQFYSYPQLHSPNKVFFSGLNTKDKRSFYLFEKNIMKEFFSEGDSLNEKMISFLFQPSLNAKDQISFKVRMGKKGEWEENKPDEIYLLSKKSEGLNSSIQFKLIAQDKDSDSRSPYIKFGNSVSINNLGEVAFTTTFSNLKRAVMVSSKDKHLIYAIEGENDVTEIEMFKPVLNDLGIVLFRAKDNDGRRALFLSDGETVKKIIREGDGVETDIGSSKILNHPKFPGIGGEVSLNNEGEIVFFCILSDKNNKELGSAVFKLNPKK